jgi:hypothetical protein
MKHAVAWVLMLALSGCAHFFSDVKDCGVEAGKDVQADLLPAVRRTLELLNPVTVELEMAKLVMKYGHSFVACMVSRVGSDAEHVMQAAPDGDNSKPLLVKTNARNWLATHQK